MAANTIPQWLFGKNLVITAGVVTINGSTGVVTDPVNTFTFFGILDVNPLTQQDMVTKVDVSPSDNPYTNKVIVEQGSQWTITEIPQASAPTVAGTADTNSGLYKNALLKLSQLGFHYKFVCKVYDNANTLVQTETIYLQYAGLRRDTQKLGKSTHQMVLENFTMVNGGAYVTNPAFT